MKIYQLRTISDSSYAHIHAQMGQHVTKGRRLRVCWDNFLAKGNKLSDWIYSYYLICSRHVAEILTSRFSGLDYIELEWNKNPAEECAKNINRLKWLPKETADLVHIYSPIEVQPLKESSIEYEPSVINNKPCVAHINGMADWSLPEQRIIPRKQGMGLFLSDDEISAYDFFRPINTPILLCKESVKNELEQSGFKNLIFLEVGESVI